MTKCPVCLLRLGDGAFRDLATHLSERASGSDHGHVRWLNQNIGRRKISPDELAAKVAPFFDIGEGSLKSWFIRRFIQKFYGPTPHPFVLALQHPSAGVLRGYVVEHQHFLRQWVRSCAHIIARTDEPDVILYELDNLNTEFGGQGPDKVAHYELLLRMGESLGLQRSVALATPPLPATRRGIEGWERIACSEPWVEAVGAMHGLELIANRNLVHEGASMRYFDPEILDGSEITPASKAFLREGYEADVGHSDQALDLVGRFARSPEQVQGAQATFLCSIDLFDDYLTARLERGAQLEG